MGYLGEKRLKAKTSMVKLAIEKFAEGSVVGVGLARLKKRPAIGSVLNQNILYGKGMGMGIEKKQKE